MIIKILNENKEMTLDGDVNAVQNIPSPQKTKPNLSSPKNTRTHGTRKADMKKNSNYLLS